MKTNQEARTTTTTTAFYVTCSEHQKNKPGILQFMNLKCCIKTREPLKPPFLIVYFFLFITLKNILRFAFTS